MKTYDRPAPAYKLEEFGLSYLLHQISWNEMQQLLQRAPIFGFPLFFAYKEINPDGSECNVPMYATWPKVMIQGSLVSP